LRNFHRFYTSTSKKPEKIESEIFNFVLVYNLKDILKQYWNYDFFRPLQEEIMLSALEGKDTLALLPTGGGKSICFQVPALAKDGLCLVVSPLIALMQDQVNNLNRRNIKATALTSALSAREYNTAFDNALLGGDKFLYVSPERLDTGDFRQRIRHQKINLIAIDEAHCVSQWGYDFRPSYLKIAGIRELFPDTPVMALTATATEPVVKDITEKLKFRNNKKIFRKSFERKNLHYLVSFEENKLNRILQLCKKINGSGIIYVRTRKKTQELSDFLNANHISSSFYHAGLEAAERLNRQTRWVANQIRIMVATNAFGMGIDKPDVRLVIHLDLPESLESYYQEAGRAGRDEKQSWAYCLYQQRDILELKENLNLSFPEMETIKKVYTALGNFFQIAVGAGKETTHDFNLNELAEKYKIIPRDIFSSLKFLEKEGYLIQQDAFYQPSRLMFTANQGDLYNFQVRNPKLDIVIKTILRTYGGLFTHFSVINEELLARRCNLNPTEFRALLKRMQEMEILQYFPQSGLPKITFLENRVDARHLYISPENYKLLKQRAEEKINAVVRYTTDKQECRSRILLEYFNETNASDCGQCDVCIDRNGLFQQQENTIEAQIIQLCSSRSFQLDELVSALYHFDSRLVVERINQMVEEGKINLNREKIISVSKSA
jgi:ATP-dependent DNA helicase RecQ